MTAAVEFVDADCAVPNCGEFTVGHESPVMPGLTEDGQLVWVELQWCPMHAAGFELLLTDLDSNGQGTRERTSVKRRFGYDQALSGFISA